MRSLSTGLAPRWASVLEDRGSVVACVRRAVTTAVLADASVDRCTPCGALALASRRRRSIAVDAAERHGRLTCIDAAAAFTAWAVEKRDRVVARVARDFVERLAGQLLD